VHDNFGSRGNVGAMYSWTPISRAGRVFFFVHHLLSLLFELIAMLYKLRIWPWMCFWWYNDR